MLNFCCGLNLCCGLIQSDSLYDLDSEIPDVIGLRAMQPVAAVVKVMSIPNNRCVWVVISDNNIGTDGFHEILIHDMADADTPDVPSTRLAESRFFIHGTLPGGPRELAL